ncbi:catechol-2,3-dioxygenase [Pullulanibacillus pueri]|uniref:VOC domain-containing protein n=2 Tax=Pullulanibacillus pueri TaxID=1437324 RepID=A0A8J2ZTK6_9BACL|nr:catechol-2,3-dioxygenase [Pullulanibacillus pueri]GGH77835.1 hypothetical protein GCM10007096_10320 [Pullulanibacillus pueri]
MRIQHLHLETYHLEEMKDFYVNTLLMELVREHPDTFMVQIGDSFITFKRSQSLPYYHFACLINTQGFHDITLRLEAKNLGLERGYSKLWQAEQFYFKDPDGNIVEILGREEQMPTLSSPWIRIVEVGLPSPNIETVKEGLVPLPNQYKDDSETFQFYGDQDGVFVLVKEGRHWYPTNKGATIHPISIDIALQKEFRFDVPNLPYFMNSSKPWSDKMPVTQMRVARPTDRFDDVVRFYQEGLGLHPVTSFAGHQGYKGVVFGLPDVRYQLEFTQHEEGSPCPAPTKDNLLVFYIPDKQAQDTIVQRLHTMGYHSVPPENPYWEKSGVTFEDPDGWRIVLMNTTGLSSES